MVKVSRSRACRSSRLRCERDWRCDWPLAVRACACECDCEAELEAERGDGRGDCSGSRVLLLLLLAERPAGECGHWGDGGGSVTDDADACVDAGGDEEREGGEGETTEGAPALVELPAAATAAAVGGVAEC